MSYPTAELLGRVERRRRFSVEQKLAVLAEAMAPGANMSEVARRHGLVPTQVYKWRRLAELGVIGMPGASELPSFVAVEIAKDVPSLPAVIRESKPAAVRDAPRRRQRKKAGLIEIELAGGRRVRVDRDVDAAALERVLEVRAQRHDQMCAFAPDFDRSSAGFASRNAGLVSIPSALALMFAKPTLMSLAQYGTRPQRNRSRLRPPAFGIVANGREQVG